LLFFACTIRKSLQKEIKHRKREREREKKKEKGRRFSA